MRLFVLLIGLMVLPGLASGTPIAVAGFTFAEGEQAFADGVIFLGGPLLDINLVRAALIGSDLLGSFNTGDSGHTLLEIRFIDNAVQNGPGVDLVIFERSGSQPLGSPDLREIFDISVYDGSSFRPYVTVTPISTGFIDTFAVQVDLSSFGVAPGVIVDRIRVGVYNVNLGSKSADLTAVGALHSVAAIPEPSTLMLTLFGLLGIQVFRGRDASRAP